MDKIILYTGQSCASSRKAKQFLEKNNIPHTHIRITKKTEIDKDFIKKLLEFSQEGVEGVVKRNYLRLIENLKLSELIVTIAQNPTMLKTPIVYRKKRFVDQVIIGYTDDEFNSLINRTQKVENYKKLLLSSAAS